MRIRRNTCPATARVSRLNSASDPGGESVPPTVLLAGRLQWITLPQHWRFLPDKPPADDLVGIGFGNDHPLANMLASRGITVLGHPWITWRFACGTVTKCSCA